MFRGTLLTIIRLLFVRTRAHLRPMSECCRDANRVAVGYMERIFLWFDGCNRRPTCYAEHLPLSIVIVIVRV